MLAEPPAAVPPARTARTVAVLPVRGEMDAITVAGLADRVEWSRLAGADAVVLALDTPGGEMLSTLELCRQIKSTYPANTIAWIAPRAFSAGTITALACREIVVTPDAVFGDAAPIAVLPGMGLQPLGPAERAKLEAPLLSEVTDSARRRRHDERLCHAFVRTDAAAWLLEDPERGERFVVDAEEYEGVFGEPPPLGASDTRPRAAMKLVPWVTDALRRAGSGLDQATQDAIDAAQSLPPGRPALGPEDAERLRLVSRLDGPDTLLTLRADEAVALGMAVAVIPDLESLRRFTGATSIFVVEPRWSETAARFLTSWWLRTLLVLVIVVCFVIEMFTPGLGAFAIAGAAAAAVLVAGPLLAGLADWWPAVLLVAGLALVAVEVLLLPGSLAAGIAGVLCFAVGTVGLFVVSSPSPQPQHAIMQGLGTLVAALVAALGTMWWLGRSGGLAQGSVLEAAIASASSRAQWPAVGAEGVASTDLRPSGRVEIGGALHEAAASGWIDRGTRIRVVDVTSDVLRVEAIPS